MISRARLTPALILGLAACTTPSLPTGAIDTTRLSGDAKCFADPAQSHIGEQATDALGRQILKETGSKSLRWGGPDTAMTMDYRPDRVTVIYDAGGAIERITCG